MRDAVDFDFSSVYRSNEEYWKTLRDLQRRGPVMWVVNHGGYWAATGYEVVLRMAQDWSVFSSAEGVIVPRPGPEVVPYKVPIETDPPRQRAYRRQMNPHFTARALAVYEEAVRDVADEMIDGLISQGTCDIAKDFARTFPGAVFFRLIIGRGEEELKMVEPISRELSFEPPGSPRWVSAATAMHEWASSVLASRVCDDEAAVIRAILNLNDSGVEFEDHEHISGLQLLTQGGIGTSASAISVIMRVLCEDRALQDRVRADITLVPILVEECLRFESPLPLVFRTAHRDIEVAGKSIKTGEKVGLFFGAANRDPTVFDRPDEVNLDRVHWRHLTFGAGVHRCIGANLARMQIRVAIEQLLARLAEFWLPDGAQLEYASLQARGPVSVPLAFTPAD